MVEFFGISIFPDYKHIDRMGCETVNRQAWTKDYKEV
jgi:hypothetical protein